MPVRPRRQRVRRFVLTAGRMMDLEIGPEAGVDVEELRPYFVENRRRFSDNSWAVQWFEYGYDTRAVDSLKSALGCPGLH